MHFWEQKLLEKLTVNNKTLEKWIPIALLRYKQRNGTKKSLEESRKSNRTEIL